jgi:hypothetical protein
MNRLGRIFQKTLLNAVFFFISINSILHNINYSSYYDMSKINQFLNIIFKIR